MLSATALEKIFAHAVDGYPREVCGLVFAARDAGGYPDPEVQRCENQHAASRTAYSLSAADVMSLARSLETDRPARIVYHSHIDIGAYFSDEDVMSAAPGGALLVPVDHLVVDVRERVVRGAKLYRFDAGRFGELARY